jgi:hypothetical protein
MEWFFDGVLLPMACIVTGINWYLGNYKTAFFCTLLNLFSIYCIYLKLTMKG